MAEVVAQTPEPAPEVDPAPEAEPPAPDAPKTKKVGGVEVTVLDIDDFAICRSALQHNCVSIGKHMVESIPAIHPTTGKLREIQQLMSTKDEEYFQELGKIAMIRWWGNAKRLKQYEEHFGGIDGTHRKKINDVFLSLCSAARLPELVRLVESLNLTAVAPPGDEILFNYSGDKDFVLKKDKWLNPHTKRVNALADELHGLFDSHGQGELFLATITEVMVHYLYSLLAFFVQKEGITAPPPPPPAPAAAPPAAPTKAGVKAGAKAEGGKKGKGDGKDKKKKKNKKKKGKK